MSFIPSSPPSVLSSVSSSESSSSSSVNRLAFWSLASSSFCLSSASFTLEWVDPGKASRISPWIGNSAWESAAKASGCLDSSERSFVSTYPSPLFRSTTSFCSPFTTGFLLITIGKLGRANGLAEVSSLVVVSSSSSFFTTFLALCSALNWLTFLPGWAGATGSPFLLNAVVSVFSSSDTYADLAVVSVTICSWSRSVFFSTILTSSNGSMICQNLTRSSSMLRFSIFSKMFVSSRREFA